MAIKPGISFSAISISLRPNSAREMSLTLYSGEDFCVLVCFVFGSSVAVVMVGFLLLGLVQACVTTEFTDTVRMLPRGVS